MKLSTVDAFKHMEAPGTVVLSDGELKRLQRVLTEILNDVADFCERRRIVYTLGGGSCLGAVRHGGFVPWDDDVDLNMPRAEYERFLPLFREAFGDKYWIHTPRDTHNHGLLFTRICLKGTSVRTREDFCSREAGAFIDLFVVENTYDNPLLRLIHGAGCMAFGYLVSCRKFYRDRRRLLALAGDDAALRRTFRLKILIGRLISFRGIDDWTRAGDTWYGKCRDGRSRYVSVPSGRGFFFRETYLRTELCRTKRYPFEGRQRRCPAGTSVYLRRLYGDWRRLPRAEEIERHVFFRPFDLGAYGREESDLL